MAKSDSWFSRLSTEERGQLQFAGLLGITSLMIFSGSVMMAQALGLIGGRSEAIPARVFAFLFGAVIAAAAAGILFHTLLAIAASLGVRSGATLYGAWRLFHRITLESAISAAMMLPLVWSYWRVTRGLPGLGFSREALIDLVPIEFLIIHGFPFIVLAALGVAAGGRGRILGAGAVIGLVSLYSLLAWDVAGGPWGIVGFLYLVIPNVLAFAKRDSGWNVRIAAISRWALKFFCLFGLAVVMHQESLRGDGNLALGLYYFGSQVLVELFRLPELSRDLGVLWARVPTGVRQRLSFMNQRSD